MTCSCIIFFVLSVVRYLINTEPPIPGPVLLQISPGEPVPELSAGTRHRRFLPFSEMRFQAGKMLLYVAAPLLSADWPK